MERGKLEDLKKDVKVRITVSKEDSKFTIVKIEASTK